MAPVPLNTRQSLKVGAIASFVAGLLALYVGLALSLGFAVYIHLDVNASLLSSGDGSLILRWLAYFGPAVVGVILVFFLFKPLAAPRRAIDLPGVVQTRRDQPELFRFVDAIASLMNVPTIDAVHFTCDVNAAVHEERLWWGLRRGPLVLHLGLPLLGGLTRRQLAALVGHELGHVLQRSTARADTVANNVTQWFAWAAFVEDDWDRSLHRWTAESNNGFVVIVLGLAELSVALTRRLLAILARWSLAATQAISRQNEFDADRYAARLGGSKSVADLMWRVEMLNMAAGKVDCACASEGTEVDLPGEILRQARLLSSSERQQAQRAVRAGDTCWQDSHPADRLRIEAAWSLSEPGVYTGSGMAQELVEAFGALGRDCTARLYGRVSAQPDET